MTTDDLRAKERCIGQIGNYYGGLSVKEQGGRFWWSIENYDGDHWEEITKQLYDALVAFEDAPDRSQDKTP